MPCLGGFAGALPLRLRGDDSGISASQHARLAADTLAKKRTSPLCVFSWGVVSAEDAPAVIGTYRGMNGVGLAHAPASSIVTADALRFTWATPIFTDPYQVSEPLAIRQAQVSISRATAAFYTYRLLPNGVEIFVFDAAGAIINPQPAGTCALW
jgi:hypothetical protein